MKDGVVVSGRTDMQRTFELTVTPDGIVARCPSKGTQPILIRTGEKLDIEWVLTDANGSDIHAVLRLINTPPHYAVKEVNIRKRTA